MTNPQLPPLPALAPASLLGVGVDLVYIPDLAKQLALPGTTFAQATFTARELRHCARRAHETGSTAATHLAGRWAVKEAFIKAWSQAINQVSQTSLPPLIAPTELNWQEIEIRNDRWNRPSLHLSGAVKAAVERMFGVGAGECARWLISLTHDEQWAGAITIFTSAL